MRNYATQVPDIGNSLCAVVDFDGSDAALKAVRELKEKYNDTGMRLALLGMFYFLCSIYSSKSPTLLTLVIRKYL